MMPRQRVRQLVDTPRFQQFITVVILLNAATLGFETSSALVRDYGELLAAVDRLTLVIFVAELTARIYAHGLRFFRDPWNWFDTIIVGVALVPATGAFAVLRALRILRALRLLSVVPSMRRVVTALLTAVPGMASIAALLALVLYIAAVMATKLFRDSSPEHFGNLGASLFTLFQVMTGEAWSDVARAVMREEPMAWIFFVGYIFITSFIVLNLFIAVTVSAMESQVSREQREHAQEEAAVTREVLAEVRQLRDEVAALREHTRAPA